MVGIVLLSHGKMAEGLLDSAAFIFGDVSGIKTVSLIEGENIDDFKREVVAAVEQADEGEGVLAFVDLFGASPYNASMYAKEMLGPKGKKIRIVTGLNLAMLVEVLAMRSALTLEELTAIAIQTGREGIQESVVVKDDAGDDY